MNRICGSRLEGTTLIVETGEGEVRYDSRFLVAALLVYIARGSGSIEPEESAKMIDLIEDHFGLDRPESLELLTGAMSEMAERPDLATLLSGLGPALSNRDKEDIALMGLQVVAADGRRAVAELEQFNHAMEAVGIAPEIVHRAFDRYFAETMPDI